MQRTIGGILLLLGVVGCIIFVVTRDRDPRQTQTLIPPQSKTQAQVSDPTPASVEPEIFTLTDIQTHNSVSSCWTIVNGLVYDVTTWINSHPGGKEAIISMCGKDSTSAFMLQHGDNEKVARILADFKIGVRAE